MTQPQPAPAALTAVSLFAGIGGFDLALHRAGVKVAAAVEIDPACRAVLARHFPSTTLLGDVSEVTGDQLRTAGFDPRNGILAAGWPCQGNSVAGRRRGMADPRSGLWRHVVRLLAESRPLWFLGENVPGLLGVNNGQDFAAVLRDLDDLGYGVAWRVLDAQWFGVPQRRRRLFLAGCLGNGTAPVEVLLEPARRGGHPPAGTQAGARVAGTLAASSGSGGLGGVGQSASAITSRLVGTAATLQGGGRRGHRIDAEGAAGHHLLPVPVAVRGRDGGSGIEAGKPGDPAFTLRTPGGGSSYPMVAQPAARGVAPTLRTHPRPGSADPGAVTVAHALTSEGADASEDGTGRGTPLVPVFAPLTAGGGGGRRKEDDWNLSDAGAAVRRLTPRECERLQGFPDDWTAGQSDAARYRQLGNAVAVPVAAWIARRIAADLDARPSIDEGAA
jgi:DNA (cytosine-5)-methyltransferase 1